MTGGDKWGKTMGSEFTGNPLVNYLIYR